MSELHAFSNAVLGGTSASTAKRALIMVHGRGDTSRKMQVLAHENADDRYYLVFPEATNHTWYPKSFMAPTEENQPWLDSTIACMEDALQHVRDAGFADENIYFLGFSQGACVALEIATQNASKFGGVMVLSGGLIGPDIDLSKYQGDFAGTPILIGCSDVDHHIPVERLHESAEVVKNMGANVDLRIYPGMDHIINEDETKAIQEILK